LIGVGVIVAGIAGNDILDKGIVNIAGTSLCRGGDRVRVQSINYKF
jgi:hypothetical protein